ncbi:MAG: S1 RNA-binding domain-containing protein [Synechococcus sp.]|uniref:S1 RNA-binding domain-containing protein n=1 Tax=Synechococcus sp. BMK-MC-1 TaxID=1442551 RepID=UPI000CA19B51|nr:S1 RNA-binding domain-containing protein [Synechococcus sp. BMK-MC-1]ATW00740.1 30S ribosomal protein S1 [Synechococcus sp. BMK-MC-1]QNI66873.1 30S ribosomal protein S1 [Synechococcus sp. BMK-MC-1]
MAGTERQNSSSESRKAAAPAAQPPKKPLQVMHISKREEQDRLRREAQEARAAADAAAAKAAQLEQAALEAGTSLAPPPQPAAPAAPRVAEPEVPRSPDDDDFGGMTMADLMGGSKPRQKPTQKQQAPGSLQRSVDDFDFDEDAFLAALDENEPVGTTGDVVTGTVIGMESDGVYVDIGGKAPGFMPKSECGLGVITNLKERFPKGLEIEVLVTREQNADGMVTISCRALALRQSWDKVKQLEKEGKVAQVKVSGFNRGGVTCDLEGLRGFIPRSQLQEGENHEALVGKTLGVAFLEVNPETRKLVLSEKKAATAARFAELEVGQLVEGHVAAVKPYGLFIDLGGISGLLHQSMITGGSLRSLREVFDQGDTVKALITELDPGRGRIALNTAMLEGQPGELLINRDAVMAEAAERANRARNVLRQQEQSAG